MIREIRRNRNDQEKKEKGRGGGGMVGSRLYRRKRSRNGNTRIRLGAGIKKSRQRNCYNLGLNLNALKPSDRRRVISPRSFHALLLFSVPRQPRSALEVDFTSSDGTRGRQRNGTSEAENAWLFTATGVLTRFSAFSA